MRTGASGNVDGGTGTGSDFLREMGSSGTFIPDTNPEQNIPHGYKSASNLFFVVVASLSLWLQTGKYPKVRSPQSRKLN